MDLASVIGFISGITFLVMAILINASFDLERVGIFINAPSAMITIGGTIAAVLIAFPLKKIMLGMNATKQIFKVPNDDPAAAITNIITLANMARKEGILSLEDAVADMDDEFMKKGIMLIVDGTDPELVRSILETEMAYIEDRHSESRGVWELVGTLGPAWGMIGTLVGLILMLQNLSDLSALGPSMAVAILTTFYGSVIANFIANPIAGKLKVFDAAEMHIKEVLVEGILSIQAGENPRIIEEKLRAFLSPALRRSMDGGNDDAKGGGEE